MAGPPPTTYISSNTPFTYQLWNDGPAALDDWMRNVPTAVLIQTVAQSIPDSSATAISFDNTVRDNYGGHYTPGDVPGDGYTVQVGGIYHVTGITNLDWTGAPGRYVGSYLIVNSQTYWAVTEVPAYPNPVRFQHRVAADIPMSAGDYVQLYQFQNSGAAQPTGFAACGARMCVRWIAV